MKAQKDLPFIPYKQENNTFAKYNRLHPTKTEGKMEENIGNRDHVDINLGDKNHWKYL